MTTSEVAQPPELDLGVEVAGSLPPIEAVPTPVAPSRSILGRLVRSVLFWQLLIVVLFLAAWEYVPKIPGIDHVLHFADPFFISSPSRVYRTLERLMVTGADQTPLIWHSLLLTYRGAFIGVGSGMIVGAVLGLLCSHWLMLNRISRPFLITLNAVPKVALIPVIILLTRSAVMTTSVSSFISVFFLIFFNAFQGGSSVPNEMIQNSRLLGATGWDIMRKVRWPFVLQWTFAQVPTAISVGLVATVTAEIFTGAEGIGRTLVVALSTSASDITFAVVIILATIAVTTVRLADRLKGYLLRWQ